MADSNIENKTPIVIYNKETGQPEAYPADQANQLLQQGSHEVPLIGADGGFESAPSGQAQNLIAQGSHRLPNPDELRKIMTIAKFSTPVEQAKTAVEGALSAASFGASTKAQIAMGISKPEDIQARRDINPIPHTLGAAAALLVPTGDANVAAGMLKGIGEIAEGATFGEKAIQMAEAAKAAGEVSPAMGLLEQAGRSAVNDAAQAMAFQGGDELSQHFSDPNRSIGTAALNIGMAGLVAPVLGGASSLVKSGLSGAINNKLTSAMEAVKNSTGADLAGNAADMALSFLPRPAEKLIKMAGKIFKNSMPEAVDTIMNRFTKSANSAVDPEAIASAISTAQNSFKGLAKIDKAVESILPAGSGAVGSYVSDLITDKQQEKLEKAALLYAESPHKFIDMNNKLGVYEPDHAMAQTGLITRAMEAINAAKPKTTPLGILDAPMKPSKIEEANYKTVLQTVQNPLSIFHHVSRGTLTPNLLNTFSTVYPDLHNIMKEKITNQIIELRSIDKNVPYKQRLAFSLFLGTPLDATMTPQAIMSNQPHAAQPQMPSQAMQQPRGSKNALTKMPGIYSTSGQAREKARAMR